MNGRGASSDEVEEIVVRRMKEADKRLLQTLDYVVAGGDVFRPVWEDYGGTMHIERVDEIPKEYWGAAMSDSYFKSVGGGETYRVPSECLNCGGPIDFAERQRDDKTVMLCRGECGKWAVMP